MGNLSRGRSPPHSTQLIGLELKRMFNLNWLADMRDPWTEIYYNKEGGAYSPHLPMNEREKKLV